MKFTEKTVTELAWDLGNPRALRNVYSIYLSVNW